MNRRSTDGKEKLRFFRTFCASLATLALVMLVHSWSNFSPSLLPLYVAPIWLAVHLDGLRGGGWLVLLSGAAMAHAESRWDLKAGESPSMAYGVVLSLGLMMLLMAWVEESLRHSRQMALEDPLTGLLNRRGFFESIERRRGRVSQHPMIVVAIDFDNFKLINDRYGHEAGDRLLRVLAEVIHDQTRDSDVVARLGGDEFVLVVDRVAPSVARQIVRRIEREFEAAARECGFECSITAGFAEQTRDHDDLRTLLRAADQAMYVRKDLKRAQAFLN